MRHLTKLYGPPGTGKTTELLSMMETAGRLGFFAFTRAAAKEARERLGRDRDPRMTTLHSLCYHELGLAQSQVMDIDHLRAFSAMTGIPCEGKNTFGAETVAPGDVALEAIHKARSLCVPLSEVPTDEPHGFVANVAEQYALYKDAHGVLDFDDMLDRFVEQHSGDLELDDLFIDEGQDLSPLQWRVVAHIAQHVVNVVIAGDDDQCIYPWAGADPLGMERFGRKKCTRRILDQSHRIPRVVHDLAHEIIARIPDRVEKPYKPRDEVGNIYRFGDLTYAPRPSGSTLILFRNHGTRAEVLDWLMHIHPIPFLGVGSPFQSKWAVATRTWRRLQEGREVGTGHLELLAKCAPDVAPRLKAGDMGWVHWNPLDAMDRMPDGVRAYLGKVDLEAEPTVRISTIHASKGAQADRVVLMAGMGERTWAEQDVHEHRVWYVGVTRARHRLDIVDGPNAYSM